jgi:hypothetical protein
MTLVGELRRQNEFLRQELARACNANLVLSIERDILSRKLYGLNTHPDAVTHLREACKSCPYRAP